VLGADWIQLCSSNSVPSGVESLAVYSLGEFLYALRHFNSVPDVEVSPQALPERYAFPSGQSTSLAAVVSRLIILFRSALPMCLRVCRCM
jgi:hypothetical protein